MFENLSDRLERSFKDSQGGKDNEGKYWQETLKDVRRALPWYDVSYKVAKAFTDTVKQKVEYECTHSRLSLDNSWLRLYMMSWLSWWVVRLSMNLSGRPSIILMSGLQGSGEQHSLVTGKHAPTKGA